MRFAIAALLIGCTPTSEPAQKAPEPVKTAEKPVGVPGDVFGKKPDTDSPFVALAYILKDPKQYNGKKVRTRGEVVAVCQAAGCWCDLKPEAGAAVIPTHVSP